MPEGPEVKLKAKELSKALVGKIYSSVNIISGSIKNSEKSVYVDFRRQISILNKNAKRENIRIKFTKVQSKGKYLYFELHLSQRDTSTDTWKSIGYKYIGNHFMMTGKWSTQPVDDASVEFAYCSGNGNTQSEIFFSDPRGFAYMEVLTRDQITERLKELGPDILEGMPFELFKERFETRPRAALASVLSDQHVVSGIGNYLRSDILWKAKLAPRKTVNTLTDKQWQRLYDAAVDIPQKSYSEGGSGNYMNGNYKMLVYKKDKDPKGNDVVRTKIGSQNVYWVRKLQKE
jgi:formamidopyrimidine-DNA glycosylase